MDAAVRNMVAQAGLPLEAVLPLATEVPAAVLGVADRKGKITDGYDADLVILSPELAADRVFVRGREALWPTTRSTGAQPGNRQATASVDPA
jgi:N-acetylglucosamine-6-phosphate deacetylase